MNQRLKNFIVILTILSISYISGCSSSGNVNSSVNPSAVNPSADTYSSKDNSLPANEQNNSTNNLIGAKGAQQDPNLNLEKMLTYAIQDEYLAYTEYKYVLDSFGDQKPFSNIINAEEKHISFLVPLFAAHNLVVPDNRAKDYIYHPATINEALEIGVKAEVDNIAMYESFLKRELPDDVKTVFIELRDASKLHLAAFQKSLNK